MNGDAQRRRRLRNRSEDELTDQLLHTIAALSVLEGGNRKAARSLRRHWATVQAELDRRATLPRSEAVERCSAETVERLRGLSDEDLTQELRGGLFSVSVFRAAQTELDRRAAAAGPKAGRPEKMEEA